MRAHRYLLAAAVVLFSGATLFAQSFVPVPGTQPAASTCPAAEGRWDYTTGNLAPSIYLNMPCTTGDAIAFVDIQGDLLPTSSTNIHSLGFDIANDSASMAECSAGLRWNIVVGSGSTATKFTYAGLGCNQGTQTDLGNGWTRVVFDQTAITAAYAGALDATTFLPNPILPTDNVIVGGLYIIMDAQGNAHLDNIMVNGTVVGASPAETTPVPTLNEYALGALALMLGAAALLIMKR